MGNRKAHPHPLCTYIRAVAKQAHTRYTREGYAYTGVSLIPRGRVFNLVGDYLDVNLIRIFDTNSSLPAMSCKAAFSRHPFVTTT